MSAESGAQFLIVASYLAAETVAELESSDAALWVGCEDGRARSAISRAYYAVFRRLKARLLRRRIEWRDNAKRFPTENVHKHVRLALEQSLGEKHPLARNIRTLLYKRNDADYAFTPTCHIDNADDQIIAAEEAIGHVDALTEEELDNVAMLLHNLDATAKLRRSGK